MKMTRKGYGRIYVMGSADIAMVAQIIHGMDPFEFDYLPIGFIAPFSEYPKLVYTGKFDGLDMSELAAACFGKGIPILVIDNGNEEFMDNAIEKYKDKVSAR